MRAGRRVILHVGAPKTGSTYLQKRLRANSPALRARGVYVPILPEVAAMAGNAKLLATILGGEPTPSFRRAFPDLDVARLTPERVLSDLLQDWRIGAEDVVLSAENFRPSHAAWLNTALPRGVETTVVMFMRRQDLWIESYFNQLTKTRDIAIGLDTFVQTLCRTDGERLCRPDWLAHHEAWSARFERVRMVCYDACKPMLFKSFLAAAELPPAWDVPDVPRAQVSMDTFQLAYLAGLPPDLPFPSFLKHRAACEEVAGQDGVDCRTSLLGSAALCEIATRYRASNTRLLERLGQPELEPLLQPQTSPAASAPLQDLLATPAFRRFHEAVETLLETRRPEVVA